MNDAACFAKTPPYSTDLNMGFFVYLNSSWFRGPDRRGQRLLSLPCCLCWQVRGGLCSSHDLGEWEHWQQPAQWREQSSPSPSQVPHPHPSDRRLCNPGGCWAFPCEYRNCPLEVALMFEDQFVSLKSLLEAQKLNYPTEQHTEKTSILKLQTQDRD